MLTNDTILVVRLPQADKRRIKGVAATQGLPLGQPILQAFDAWASQLSIGRTSRPSPERSRRHRLGGAGTAEARVPG